MEYASRVKRQFPTTGSGPYLGRGGVWTVLAEESTEAVVAHLDNLRLDRRWASRRILRAFFRTEILGDAHF